MGLKLALGCCTIACDIGQCPLHRFGYPLPDRLDRQFPVIDNLQCIGGGGYPDGPGNAIIPEMRRKGLPFDLGCLIPDHSEDSVTLVGGADAGLVGVVFQTYSMSLVFNEDFRFFLENRYTLTVEEERFSNFNGRQRAIIDQDFVITFGNPLVSGLNEASVSALGQQLGFFSTPLNIEKVEKRVAGFGWILFEWKVNGILVSRRLIKTCNLVESEVCESSLSRPFGSNVFTLGYDTSAVNSASQWQPVKFSNITQSSEHQPETTVGQIQWSHSGRTKGTITGLVPGCWYSFDVALSDINREPITLTNCRGVAVRFPEGDQDKYLYTWEAVSETETFTWYDDDGEVVVPSFSDFVFGDVMKRFDPCLLSNRGWIAVHLDNFNQQETVIRLVNGQGSSDTHQTGDGFSGPVVPAGNITVTESGDHYDISYAAGAFTAQGTTTTISFAGGTFERLTAQVFENGAPINLGALVVRIELPDCSIPCGDNDEPSNVQVTFEGETFMVELDETGSGSPAITIPSICSGLQVVGDSTITINDLGGGDYDFRFESPVQPNGNYYLVATTFIPGGSHVANITLETPGGSDGVLCTGRPVTITPL